VWAGFARPHRRGLSRIRAPGAPIAAPTDPGRLGRLWQHGCRSIRTAGCT